MSVSRHLTLINGLPVPAYSEPYTPEQSKSDTATAASKLYVPLTYEANHPLVKSGEVQAGDLLPGEEDFVGMTALRVAKERRQRAAAYGDFDALDKIENRLEGKPRQQIEQLTVTTTLQDMLQQIHDHNNLPVDVQVVPTTQRDILDGI